MNKEQEALNMLDQAVSQLQAPRDVHFKLQQAVKILQEYTEPHTSEAVMNEPKASGLEDM